MKYVKNILKKTFTDFIELSLVQTTRFNTVAPVHINQKLAVGMVSSIHHAWNNIEFVRGIVVHGSAHSTHAAIIPIKTAIDLLVSLNFEKAL